MGKLKRSVNRFNPLLFLLLVFSAFLFSCEIEPTYRRERAAEEIRRICRDEYGIEVRLWDEGDTVWIHAPMEMVSEEGKFRLDEKNRWEEEIQETMRNVSTAISRVFMSSDRRPRFYCVVRSNTKRIGIDWYMLVFLPDEMRHIQSSYYLSIDTSRQYFEKVISFFFPTPDALNDDAGAHIRPYDVSMEEFIALRIYQRMLREFAGEDTEENYRVNDIAVRYDSGTLRVEFDILLEEFGPDIPRPLEHTVTLVKETLSMYESFLSPTEVIVADRFHEQQRRFSQPGANSPRIRREQDFGLLERYQVQFYLTRAAHALEEREYDRAFVFYEKASKIPNGEFHGNFGLGSVLLYREEYARAIEWYRRAFIHKPDNDDVMTNMGICHYSSGTFRSFLRLSGKARKKDYLPARGLLERAVALNPQNYTAHLSLGQVLQSLGQPGKAKMHFRLVADESDQLLQAGRAHVFLKEYEQGLTKYEEQMRKDIEDPAAYEYIGELFYHRWSDALPADPVQAKEYWRESVANYEQALEFESEAAHLPLAYLYAAVKNYPEASRHYEWIIEEYAEDEIKHDSVTRAYVGLAEFALNGSRYGRALSLLRKADRLTEENPLLHFLYGSLYFDTGKFREAKNAFERVLEVNPDNPSARYNLGLTYSRLDEYEKARRELLRAKDAFRSQGNTEMIAVIDEGLESLKSKLSQPSSSAGSGSY
ncbi:MAG: tetratricopeptide repeat protein [Candidatus Omnitrophica bacterium]|nr:tetratricopeptide repeat protein [Candidatus Omnitrophota bacterium]